MNYFGKSDIGRSRTDNQDRFAETVLSHELSAFVVCDGVGGTYGGDIASTLASECFVESLRCEFSDRTGKNQPALSETQAKDALLRAAKAANDRVVEKACEDETLAKMSTTLVALLLTKTHAYILNIGDSRAYFYAGGKLTQITKDHSYVQELIDKGRLDPKDAADHEFKNVITRSIGYGNNSKPDLYKLTLSEFESYSFLLCTDGLSNYVEPDRMKKIISSPGTMRGKVERLINCANEKGGLDNITALLVTHHN